jgi:hypothetical protein
MPPAGAALRWVDWRTTITRHGQFQPRFQSPPAISLIDRSLQRLRQSGCDDVRDALALQG